MLDQGFLRGRSGASIQALRDHPKQEFVPQCNGRAYVFDTEAKK